MRRITPDFSAHTVKAEVVLRQARLQIAYKLAESLSRLGDVLAVEMLDVQAHAAHAHLTQMHQLPRCICKPLLCVRLHVGAPKAIQHDCRKQKDTSKSMRSKRLI